jgi:hypothetical protein
MPRDSESFSLPKPGLEITPWAALTRIPLPSCTALLPRLRNLGEAALGPLVICAIYQGLLTTLRTEAAVRRGELNRKRQLRLVMGSLVQIHQAGTSSSLSVSLTMSFLLLLIPSLSLPLTVFGILGIGRISDRVFNAFWDGLNSGQKAELRRRAYAAGANLRYRVDGHEISLVR